MPETIAKRRVASSRDTPGPMSGSAGARGAPAANAIVPSNRAQAEARGKEKSIPDAIATPLGPARRELYISRMSLIVELLHSDAQPPRRATEGSAGYDLHAYLRGRAIRCSDGQRTWDTAA